MYRIFRTNKRLINKILTILSSCVFVACAGTNAGDGGVDSSRSDCIYQPSIRGYSVLDESNLIVSASGRRQYHVVLKRRAHGLRSNWAIGFRSPTGSICAPFAEVLFEGNLDGESVRIASIRELSPEDEEDLLIRFGKKEPEIEQTPVPQEVKGAEVEELDPGAGEESSVD